MDPKLGGDQNNQPQEKKSEGGIGQGIRAVNRLAGGGLRNPFGNIGSKIVVQAGSRLLALLLGPALPALVIGIIALFTLIIVMGFAGGPAPISGSQTPDVPTPTQTLPPTPTLTPEP